MRTVHLAIIILFVLAILIFAAQNFGSVTVAFLGFSVSAPLAVLAVIIYVLGMVTGSSLWALIRQSLHGARRAA
jgi:lipopolysaccharide assembly protein A